MHALERLSESLTSIKHQWLFHSPEQLQFNSILECLTNMLPHIDPDSWQERFNLGGVYLNGLRVNTDLALQAPCKVEYYEPKFEIHNIHQTFPKFEKSRIVYEDEWIIAYSKPRSLPTLPTKEQNLYNMGAYLESYLGCLPHLPSRLDTSTEGLIIASKSKDAHRKLQRIFEHRRIEKYYLLEVAGTPDWSTFDLDAAIGRDHSHAILRKVVSDGGIKARTLFTKIKRLTSETLLQAQPLTGRTHQIRVHAAHLGFSIIGDNFYNGPPAKELHLLSFAANFIHPITGEKISLSIPSEIWPEWLRRYQDFVRVSFNAESFLGVQ